MANGHSNPHVCKPECDHKVEFVKYLVEETAKIPFDEMFDQKQIEARYAATRLPALKAELREACKQLRRDVNDTLDAIEEYIKLQGTRVGAKPRSERAQEDFAKKVKS